MGERYRGLLVDFGGVLTTSMGRAFSAFCVESGAWNARYVMAVLRKILTKQTGIDQDRNRASPPG